MQRLSLRHLWILVFLLGLPGSFSLLQAQIPPSFSTESLQGFAEDDFSVELPSLFVKGISHEIRIHCSNETALSVYGHQLPAVINGQPIELVFDRGLAKTSLQFDRKEPLSIMLGPFTYVKSVTPIPLWWSIIPPLLVIVLALVFKEVLGSLLLGIFAGAIMVASYMHGASEWYRGFFAAMDGYIIDALYDRGHLSVIVFSVVIGGIVALVSKNGGMQALVHAVSKKTNSPKRLQLSTYFLGLAIFFDDYANTLVVGNTMRPLSDRMRISREKLAYIVDSTAAPVASIALITTWIGAELGYIEGALDSIDHSALAGLSPYAVFMASLQYAYYPVFALLLILVLILSGRDYGPMYRAERHARKEGSGPLAGTGSDVEELKPSKDIPLRKRNALIPVAVLVFGTLIGLLVTGYSADIWNDASLGFGEKLSLTIGDSDSYRALLWASISGLIVAVLMSTAQGILSYSKAVSTAVDGFKTMIDAVLILVLAWALAALTQQMHTADYLAGLATGSLAPWAIPAITFLMAALVAFSTGSAWGTMAILYPLILPLSWELSMAEGLGSAQALALFFNATSCVLAGAVLGDHCSPISDTTILSSLATQCDHIAHVRTQLPYALSAGGVALLFTMLSAAFELPFWLNYSLGLGLLILLVFLLGKRQIALRSD